MIREHIKKKKIKHSLVHSSCFHTTQCNAKFLTAIFTTLDPRTDCPPYTIKSSLTRLPPLPSFNLLPNNNNKFSKHRSDMYIYLCRVYLLNTIVFFIRVSVEYKLCECSYQHRNIILGKISQNKIVCIKKLTSPK